MQDSSDDDDEDDFRNEYADAQASRKLRRTFASTPELRGKKGPKKSSCVVTLRMLTLNIFIRPPMVKTNADDYKVWIDDFALSQ